MITFFFAISPQRVGRSARRLSWISRGIHHAGTCLDDGNAGGVTHKVNELAAATWNAEVYVADGVEHLACSLMGGRQQGDDVGVDAMFSQHLVDDGHARLVGDHGIAAAFQQTGVAAFEAQ